MFRTLHRLYLLGWMMLGIAVVIWVYPRTGLSEPLLDWYAVWRNKPGPVLKPVAELSGTVVRVIDGTSFTIETADRQFYNVGLLGVAAQARDLEVAERSKAQLADLVLSNEVQVALTFLDPQHRGVGVVHRGELNVNAAMVESGLVKIKHQFITRLPWRDQYALLKAERKAKAHDVSSRE